MREKWVDNLKGILIILVVIGHILPPPYNVLSTPASYIFAFHMPAFFIISGYLAKPGKYSLGASIWGKAKRILGPYFFYMFLIAAPKVITAYMKNHHPVMLKKNITTFIYGGQGLNFFDCGAVWFLTCLFVSFVFCFIIEKLPKTWMKAVVYIAFWAFAHYQSKYMRLDPTFWLWDVGIIGCVYLAIGYYFKKYIFNKWVLVGSLVSVVGFLVLRATDVVPYFRNFGIELWSHTYRYPILDFVFPCGVFVILANLVKLIPDGIVSKILSELGKYSLAIMAMHQLVMRILREDFKLFNLWILTFIATLIPYLVVRFIWSKIPGIRRISY